MLNPVPVNMQAVPSGLENHRQFINWRAVPDHDKPGKFKKLPCDLNGNIIDAHDSRYWLSAAEASLSHHPIGFVFTDRDPFWFIDIDNAWDGHRWSDLATWATEFFVGCAVEVSHSGTGLHLFGYGSFSLPADHGCRNSRLGVELYTSGRFCALTGQGKAGNAFIDYSDRLASFVLQAGLQPRTRPVEADGAEDGPDPRYTGPVDDDALVALMCGSQGSTRAMFGSKIHVSDLWSRNVPALTKHFPVSEARADGMTFDWSAADASLMWHLSFWTGRDEARMLRLFERSALYRPGKYEGRGAYRLGLLAKQAYRNPNVYDRPTPGVAAPIAPGVLGTEPAGTQRDQRATMDLARQVEHFAGCVYVEATHAVMVPDGRLLRPAVFNATYGGFSFQMQYDGAKPTTEAFTAFTENRMMKFPTAVDTCFRPDLAPSALVNGRINTWRAPKVDECEGDVTPFLDHVAKLIPDATDRAILLTYAQSLARNPGVKFQWAPVIQGAEGNGKSLIIRALYHAVTKDYSHLPKASQLTEKFNSWLEGRLFIGVEEIKVTDRREVLEDLKDAVTNEWVEIRGMNREKKMADNFTNWVFCTNHKDAIPVNRDQRRYAIFYTAQQSVDDIRRAGMDERYFKRLYDWLKKEGGLQAVAYWLRHAPLVDARFDPADMCQRAPATTSTAEAINVSLGRIEQEIMEAVETGDAGFRDGWMSTGAVSKLLETNGVRTISTRKLGEIIVSLGYVRLFRSSRKIIEEGNQQPTIYRIKGKVGTIVDYCAAQSYHRTLGDIARPIAL